MNQQAIKLPHEVYLMHPELSGVEWLRVYWVWWVTALVLIALVIFGTIRLVARYRSKRTFKKPMTPEQEAVSQIDRIVQAIRSLQILEKDLSILSRSLKLLLSQELGVNVTNKTVTELRSSNLFKSSRVEVKGYLPVLELIEKDLYGAAQSLQDAERRNDFLETVLKGLPLFAQNSAQKNAENSGQTSVSGGPNAV